MIKPILNKLFWGFFRHGMSDKQYAKMRYWLSTGEKLNLDRPKTFSEKINWLKLNDRTTLRKRVADRVLAREFVAERIGPEYLIPLVGVYDEITPKVWEMLPNQFVLKANHGSGMVRIVKDKRKENPDEIIQEIEKWKKTDYSKFGREWVYKGLPRLIVIEELLCDEYQNVPEDFKFFCYHGKVQILQIDFDRYKNHKRNFYDRNFFPLEVELLYKPYAGKVKKPKNLNEAMDLAEKLSAGFNFIRVDLYLLNNKIYFGEMTNFPGNGFEPFTSGHYDLHFGSLLKLDLPGQTT